MPSHTVPVRLSESELAMLDACLRSEESGKLNRSELIRLLIHREHARRTTGKSATPIARVSTDNRRGRPVAPRCGWCGKPTAAGLKTCGGSECEVAEAVPRL